MTETGYPPRQGLYDPQNEKDACGFGFVVDIKGRASHDILENALTVLVNLEHRGAAGAEANTGDGAGILFQTPHAFLRAEAERLGFALPAPGAYAAGMVFLPPHEGGRAACVRIFEEGVRAEGLDVLGWRDVPTDPATLGPTARSSQPVIRQILVGRGAGCADEAAFERKLYVVRRLVEKRVSRSAIPGRTHFYVPSLSWKTVVYKGMLNAGQLREFYLDLSRPEVVTGLAMVHSRFSTNTFPSWSRAHPYRYISHNGEINTLRGNINWMHARQSMMRSSLFGEDLQKILTVIDTEGSDSAMFDNVLELLTLSGRELPHAMMMMVPEPWARHEAMSPEKRAFYEFHSCLMEPWDGPASIAFTDGVRVGAVLDRNGLRPSRYYVTKDDLVVMASEVGVLDLPADRILKKGRLQPGRLFLVDTREQRIVGDDELKERIAREKPYASWLEQYTVRLDQLPKPARVIEPDHETVLRRQEVFGYTAEDVKMIVTPMATDGTEPIGSMGTDTPLAVLSEKPQPLFNYFKQLFAQVTNPPVDAIREEIIMAVETSVGPEGNLLEPGPECARQLALPAPVIRNEDLERIRALDGGPASKGLKAITLPILFRAADGGNGLRKALEDLRWKASEAIAEGHNLLVLSDRGHDAEDAPIPSLLAVAAVQHHLIREGTRTRCGIVLESGEPREVHHFALLIGYGASAVNPYLAFETIHDQVQLGLIPGPAADAEKKYVKAVAKGIVKVISKMGISTIQSYHGAQVFEAIGLNQDFIDEYFTWTATRVGGVGIDVVAREARLRNERGFPPKRPIVHTSLPAGGQYKWRNGGEHHLFNPETVHKLQYACRTGNYALFKEYSALVDNQARNLCTLRGLMDLVPGPRPVPIDEVEPVESILRRFKTGAMSYGSISKEAHESLAVAMNRIGGKSNTGEGGEDPARYEKLPGGDSKSSAIKQVASGRFGVTSQYLVNARELQIKMAQGAKPGEGGQLPGTKVYPWIAKVRHSTPGVGLISPPPHHDIYSIEDLAQLIHDLKNANHRARVSVKLVAEVGVGTIAAGVAKAHADVVLVSGHDGGTGASPLTSIKHAGIPWELGLAETHQVLVMNDLRSRIAVEVDGQLKTGRDVVIGALLGAEEFGFATAPLVVLGCVMMRACHLNTCPVGVATQDPRLRAKFTGDPAHVVTFMRFIAQEVREYMADLGYRTIEEMVGRSERLEMRRAVDHWKARNLDFSRILFKPTVPKHYGRTCQIPQDHGIDKTLDATVLLDLARPAIESRQPVRATLAIRNTNRVVGTMVGSEITRRHGPAGLPDDTIRLHFQGSAGQSFGAFVPPGMTLLLEGDANDYVGKGLSGGRVVVFPPRQAGFVPEENVIIGNVAFYGATAGEAFVRGIAGERFCVRNSGVSAVVEGVGDHGCEYMTGGKVVVLGPTGRNFAAGMSGGVAYVLDADGAFARRCNRDMVTLGPVADPQEAAQVRALVEKHAALTESGHARRLLDDWAGTLKRLVRVMPNDYRRVVEAQARMREKGLTPEQAELAAFEENTQDAARVSGN
ncbi:Glutamate synthase (ferredoxin) [Anaeromyxobacter dehalogenans 2CP-1]|uniref:Glutamate synthase [NADPH] large chain n=1 Tax=Anaeromyxobacter dehalogenans (strain ATCC BAA-258 / DSM 21875 / 2CP-1) TaxID=455488 RepID=B8JDX6_ANAD2|nr:glutamate synthase large subunit [Anaeromyxobacter dehalogenans]ACL64221.1 Glutamate synthase (ferredoxin) [Anaeromyxobacter dehalogenans 2CP-1]